MKVTLQKNILIILFSVLSLAGFSQFYNGHQMSFGKNRVQFNEFVWSYYRFDKYDVYFNEDGKNLADYTAEYAEQIIPRIEAFFDYTLEKRILFVAYNKLSDFRQSNIGLITGNDDYNIGGTTTVNRNKVFLYFEGNYDEYDIQITAAVTRILVNEMISGTDLIDNVANATLSNIPQWYSEGLIAYLSMQWDIQTENFVKDGILSGKYEKFNRLTGQDAIYAGHSFWKYIADTYGESVIPSIIYLTSISKSIKTGFSNVLGLTLKELTYDWTGYYLSLFEGEKEKTAVPETGKLLKRTKKGVVYQNVKISPTGNYLTYVTNDRGLYKIWLMNVQSGKKKRIFKREYRLDQITDFSYPVIAWHPSARYIAFMTEEKGGLKLYYYNIADKELTVRNFLYFDKVLDMSFSKEGTSFVFSGSRNGRTDIYIHDIASATNRQISNDIADDLQPRFIDNDSKIIFISNRISDTLSFAENQKERAAATQLFIYDAANNSDVLIRVSDSQLSNKSYPNEVEHNHFLSLADHSGVVNRYISKFDSTVSAVDTAIHYRYYAETAPLTQYSRNILEHDYMPESGNVAEIIYNNGRYNVYHNPLNADQPVAEQVTVTPSQRLRMKIMSAKDSVRSIKKDVIPIANLADNKVITEGDTIALGSNLIDVNKYVFEVEKINAYNEKLADTELEVAVDTAEDRKPRIRLYRPVFYQN
ncbi:MAG TPA: hypothetical protein VHI78_09070, partial [Bacteroidales bacterium]|nr:hypothetical protein [Bacteroidales bacterium]